MQSTTDTSDRTGVDVSWARSTSVGILAGLVGAVVMGAVAMIAAATYQSTGFFTPLYHIGSAFGWGESAQAMGASMDQAGAGNLFYFSAGPAAVGMLIHIMTGAAWGMLFAWVIRPIPVSRGAVVALGVLFGLVAMPIMAFLVLPAVAGQFGSGAPIRDMASMVGWGTFTLEHAVFGLVLGIGSRALAPRS
jgi:hypothetical protein